MRPQPPPDLWRVQLSRRAFLKGAAAGSLLGVASRPISGGAPAEARTQDVPGEVPRRILALYKSYESQATPEGERPKTSTLNEIHLWAQMPLNWLGLMVEYHDVSRGLPDESVMRRYQGVVTWFQSEEMDHPLAYLNWLVAQPRAGRRVVILGTLGALRDRRTRAAMDLDQVSQALSPLGLAVRGRWTTDPRLIEIRKKNPGLMEFERTFPPGLPNYFQVTSRRPDNRVWLTLGRRDLPDSDSHMVVTGPWGGFAAAHYLLHEAEIPAAGAVERETPAGVDPSSLRAPLYGAQWWINPFAFFQEALGIADWPRPDVTTLNGRRIFYSHIDGDGLRNLSEVRPGVMSGRIILEEVLARYPLPTTVSVVTAEVDPALLGSRETLVLARAMFSLPHIEAGSHSFSHPLDWQIPRLSFKIPGYRYSVEAETAGSIKYIEEHLLPPGGRVKVFQWSGVTNVAEDALGVLDRLKIPNINGGDPMFDRLWRSYTRVAPLMRQVGPYWQTYTSASNENLYTNLWTGPYYGFRQVIETFRNTGTPRRVSPINIYYHFYSGERVASLAALREVYEWVLGQPVAPLFTSEYLAMVEGFRTARIGRTSDGWRIWDHGALRTIRFDGTGREVDMERSRGVLGWTRHQGVLYVHLEGPGEAFIHFTDHPGRTPFLRSASHRVSHWRRAGAGLAFQLTGIGPKSAEIGGQPAGADVAVEVTDGHGARTLRLRAGDDGILAVAAGDADPVRIQFR